MHTLVRVMNTTRVASMHTTIVLYVCSMDIHDDDTTEVLSRMRTTHVLRKYIMHTIVICILRARVVFVSTHV